MIAILNLKKQYLQYFHLKFLILLKALWRRKRYGKKDNRATDSIEVVSIDQKFPNLKKKPFVAGAISDCHVHPKLKQKVIDSLMFLELEKPPGSTKKFDNTFVCLACFELGREKHVFSSHSSNRKSHLELHANELIEFKKIRELKGKTLRVYARDDPLPVSSSDMKMYTKSSESTLKEYESAAVRLMIANGWTLDVSNTDLFLEFIKCVRALSEDSRLRINRRRIKNNITSLYNQHWQKFRTLVDSAETKSYSLVFDCWDWGKKLKIIGVTAIVLGVYQHRLKMEKFPIIFRLLRPEGQIDLDTEEYVPILTLQSGKQLSITILDALRDQRVALHKLMSARSDGARNAICCTDILNKLAGGQRTLRSSLGEVVKNMKFCEPNCVVHWIALALKKVLFDASPKDDDGAGFSLKALEQNMPVPPGPSSSVQRFLKKVRDCVSRINEARNLQTLRNFSCSINVGKPLAIDLDLEARCFSSQEMMRNLNRMESLLSQAIETDFLEDVDLSSTDFGTIREISAILDPLFMVSEFLETSSFPTTPSVLTLIFVILQKYGVDVQKCGIMDPTKFSEAALIKLEHIEFVTMGYETHDSRHPKLETVAVANMSATAKGFFENLRVHLVYRLLASRTNRNLVELLACYCDPLGHLNFNKLFGGYGSVASETSRLMKECIKRLSKSSATDMPLQAESAPVEKASDEPFLGLIFDLRVEEVPKDVDVVEKELKAFLMDAKKSLANLLGVTRVGLSIQQVMQCLSSLQPLAFWDTGRMRQYPCMFESASAVLGFESHNCLQESLFSFESDILTNRRKRLVRSPQLLEALVVLRYKINCDLSNRQSPKASLFEDLIEEDTAEEEEEDTLSPSVSKLGSAFTDFFSSKKPRRAKDKEEATVFEE